MPSTKFHFSNELIGEPELLDELDELFDEPEELFDTPEELLDELDELVDDEELVVVSSPAPPQPDSHTAQHNIGIIKFARMSYPEKFVGLLW